MNTLPHPNSRIEIIDSLRGFALFGLFITHCVEHFDFTAGMPESEPAFLEFLNPYVLKMVFFLFAGKAYAIFSMMFGLSFFIQMDRQAKKGINFAGRFAWRLLVLLGIGYIHGLFYCGDVLTIFGLMGFSLLIFYRLKTQALLVISVLLMLQIPFLFQLGSALENPYYLVETSDMRALFNEGAIYYGSGGFWEVLLHNKWNGQMAKWLFYLDYGRYLQIAALFIWGLLLGRTRFFENVRENLPLCRKTLLAFAISFVCLQVIAKYVPSPSWSPTALEIWDKLISSYYNIAFMLVLVSGFILIYQNMKGGHLLRHLAPIGKTSLTCYVSQSIIGVFVFYHYGLGLYQYLGYTLSLCYGIVFFGLQMLVCRWWLQYFRYGPLEWCWRALTYTTWKVPFRKLPDGLKAEV